MFYKCCCHCFFLVKSYISCLFNQWRVIVIINQSWSERTSFIRTLAFHKSIKIVFLIEELCSGSLIFGKRSINLKKSFKFSNSYRFKFVKLLKVIFMRKQSENFSATRVSRYEQYLSCLSMDCSFWHQTYNFFSYREILRKRFSKNRSPIFLLGFSKGLSSLKKACLFTFSVEGPPVSGHKAHKPNPATVNNNVMIIFETRRVKPHTLSTGC